MEIVQNNSVVDPAFHGTTGANADSILADKFIPSSDTEAFLGKGVYFFDGNEEEAINWARRKSGASEWAVLSARVKLGRCLNLSNKAHCRLISVMIRHLKDSGTDHVTEAVAVSALVNVTRGNDPRSDYPNGEPL